MRYAVVCTLLLCLSGCGVEVLTTTAIQGELQAQQMQAMKGQVQRVSNQSGRINLERAIQTYRAEKGTNPSSLEELVPNYLTSVPLRADGSSYDYDPVSGALLEGSVATLPASSAAAGGPTAADLQLMKSIQTAIPKYGTATGYYPATLDDLYPTYLGKLPRTSAGEPFIYNNQNGEVTHPRPFAAAAGTSASPAPTPSSTPALTPSSGGGLSPVGEVLTGVNMRQHLDGIGNSGTGAAQGYMNRNLGATTGAHNDRQNKAMDQLGL